MKVSFNWLKHFFDENKLPAVEEVEERLMFGSYEIEGVKKVGDDFIIDIDVLPNRAADSLSHRGVAREISSLFGIPMKKDPLSCDVEIASSADSLSVSISKDSSCSYYIAARISGVKVGESPVWLKERLEAIGQKPINNVVDATNYVLFEIGQPTHVFDAKKFSGNCPGIGVRLSRSGEKITLLGGEEVELKDGITVITDSNNNVPVAIAGVKGGTVAEVAEDTTDIIIESAKFDAVQTRKASQLLKLRTDASSRYENNISDKLSQYGAREVIDLILSIAGGEFKGCVMAGELSEENVPIKVAYDRISKVLGTSIDRNEIENILNKLGFDSVFEDDVFIAKAPFERKDIRIPEDIIEEIARLHGYSKIKSKQLKAPTSKPEILKKYAYSEIIRSVLTAIGYSEVYLYSLRNKGDVKLLNSLASDKDHLRADLSSGIREALNSNESNMPLLGIYDAIRIFEIGNVFKNKVEETGVCIGVRVAGKKRKEERTNEILNYAKESLEKALGATLPPQADGVLEFSLDKVIRQLPTPSKYVEAPTIMEGIAYEPPSKYPFVLRDVAVWVSLNVSAEDVREIIKRESGNLLVRCDLFDEFEKGDKRSYAFHLVFQSTKRTLQDEEVGPIMQKIEESFKSKGWEVR